MRRYQPVNLADYRSIVFDCDGVLLHSNRLKTEAFRHVAGTIDAELAEELVAYHVANGGVSRYRKFDFFIERCRERGIQAPANEALCAHFAERVRDGLLQCSVAEGLPELRAAVPNSTWMVASGADQVELREVFRLRNLDDFFDGGVFGSPDTKSEILSRAFERGNKQRPALMLGDSLEDHRAAREADIDFMFVSGWSEFGDLENFAQANAVPVVEAISHLVPKGN